MKRLQMQLVELRWAWAVGMAWRANWETQARGLAHVISERCYVAGLFS